MTPFLCGDFAISREAGAEYRCAFKLRFGAIGIDHRSGIDDIVNARDADVAIGIDFDLDDARDVSQEAAMGGETVAHRRCQTSLCPIPTVSATCSMT